MFSEQIQIFEVESRAMQILWGKCFKPRGAYTKHLFSNCKADACVSWLLQAAFHMCLHKLPLRFTFPSVKQNARAHVCRESWEQLLKQQCKPGNWQTLLWFENLICVHILSEDLCSPSRMPQHGARQPERWKILTLGLLHDNLRVTICQNLI